MIKDGRGSRGDAIDTSTRERDIVKQVIQRYAQFKPSHGDIRLDTVFDDTQNRYALMQMGWDRGRRLGGNLIYVTLSKGKFGWNMTGWNRESPKT